MKHGLTPKIVGALRGYTPRKLLADAVAGLTVGLVALPMAITFAISSGVAPQVGLYGTAIAGFIISALGGSKTQIGGPTGAFVVIVYGIVSEHGLDGLFLCTIMAGVILAAMGITGLGATVKYIPRPVVIGFTNGIAVLIASMQIKDFFGLDIDKVPVEFGDRMEVLVAHLGTISFSATLLGFGALAIITVCMRNFQRVPGSIVAMIAGTLVVAIFGLPVETIGSRFNGIPSGTPLFHVPMFSLEKMMPLLAPALTMAILGAIISLMSAVVADKLSGDKHSPNIELVALGLANILSPLFGGLPATGAVARTVTNIRAGGTTPIAGMIHALALMGILLCTAPLAYLPLPILAAILMVVAYNMGQWREIPKIWRMSWASISVWLATYLLTVFASLTLAVEVGIVLAALLYIRSVTHTTTVAIVTKEYIEEGRPHSLQDKVIPSYVTIVRIHGPFLFGSTEKLNHVTERVEELAPIVILRLRNMTAIDATGLLTLEDLAKKLHAAGRTLILCGARPQPATFIRQAEFEEHIGAENICSNVVTALARAEALRAAPFCHAV